MRGLMTYEFLSMRKSIVSSVFIILPIIFVFFTVVTLGIEHGNLSELGLTDLSLAFFGMFVIFVTFYAGLCGYIVISGKFASDIKSWNKYSFSLPVSDMARIGARYAVSGMVTITAFFMVLGMSAILGSMAKQPADEFMNVVLVVFCIAASASHACIALLYIVKSKLIVAVIALVFSVLFVMVSITSETVVVGPYEDGEFIAIYPRLIDYIGYLIYETSWFMPLVLCVIAAFSFFISLMTAKRRERLC